jgi:NAD-reducing hydrogenase small subunit
MSRVRFATVWLDGCSGCHMSFLDMDEQILDIAEQIELVYSPIADVKEFPEGVDVTLVEGSISSDEDLEKLLKIRQRTKMLIALGDCAVTGNVPSLRNPFGEEVILKSIYRVPISLQVNIPADPVLPMLRRVRPVHDVVKVDYFVPGCPPSASTIRYVIGELLAEREPEQRSRFGA